MVPGFDTRGSSGQPLTMKRAAGDSTDSPFDGGQAAGGFIPGYDGTAAFRLLAPVPSAIPVFIAVPHAGRAYPAALLAMLRDPEVAPGRLEDRLVDRLAQAVASETGAGLLVADAPRAMIDLNRAPNDIDWGMIADAGAAPSEGGRSVASAEAGRSGPLFSGRARGGLGLIPRRLPGVGELWKGPLGHADLLARLEGVHQPYHACLASALADLAERWGAALLIDLHSMPPLPVRGSGGTGAAHVVLGDRFGASCAGSLVASAFGALAQRRVPTAHNRPYAGGYGVERHGAPRRGIHAVQIEIDRHRYLDSRLMEVGAGFDEMVAILVAMVRVLADHVARLGAARGADEGAVRWPHAAE